MSAISIAVSIVGASLCGILGPAGLALEMDRCRARHGLLCVMRELLEPYMEFGNNFVFIDNKIPL